MAQHDDFLFENNRFFLLLIFMVFDNLNAIEIAFQMRLEVSALKTHRKPLQTILANGRHVQLQAVGTDTFRIRLSSSDSPGESAMIRYRLLQLPEAAEQSEIWHDHERLTIRNGHASLQLDLNDGSLALEHRNQPLVRTASPLTCGSGFALELALHDADQLYGLGNIYPQRLERRGLRAELRTSARLPADTPIPYLMSSRGWAVLMNTTFQHTFDIGCTNADRLTVSGMEGELDFLLFAGVSLGELLERYTAVAGRPTLLPIWAYGLNYCSRDMDHARGVLDDALRFRQSSMPCDLIGLSYGWDNSEHPENSEIGWHPERFPLSVNHPYREVSFIGVLERHGFKLSVQLQCQHDITAEAERQYASEGRQPPASSDVSWYSRLKTLVADGVSAFLVQIPYPRIHFPDGRAANGMSASELHNVYPVLVSKQTYEGFREQTGKRPMIHMVAGYTGMQQYIASTSGRYQSGVEAIASVLHYGLTGHANASTNMNPITREGIHCGFLLAWARLNSQQHFRHPCWLERDLRDLFQKYAKLRYRLLPYIYNAAHQAARTGMPIIRAMPLAFPSDPACAELQTQYMLGDSLLVGTDSDRLYLPEGEWIDYWTGVRYQGPSTVNYRLPDDAGGPLLVRAGAILPMWPEGESIGPGTPARLLFALYPAGNSDYTLLEDDGTTFGYRNGEVAQTHIRCVSSSDRVTVAIGRRTGSYEGMPVNRSCELTIALARKPVSVQLNGSELPTRSSRRARGDASEGWRFDRRKGCIFIETDDRPCNQSELLIEVRYGKHYERKQQARFPTSAPSAGPLDEERQLIQTLDTAIDTLNGPALEAALQSWWEEADLYRPEGLWRLKLIRCGSILLSLAERRGWNLQHVFGEEMDQLYALREIATPEQGFALLSRLTEQLMRQAATSVPVQRHPVIVKTIAALEQDIAAAHSLQELAELASVHPFYLSRLFRQKTGKSITEYKLAVRMRQARMMLEAGVKVYETAAAVGYKDAANFSKAFSAYWGVPPKYFKMHPGTTS